VPARNVCAVTFTRRAAGELSARLRSAGLLPPHVVTLSSFVASFLGDVRREAGATSCALVGATLFEAAALDSELDHAGSTPMTMERCIAEALRTHGAAAGDADELAAPLAATVAASLLALGATWHTDTADTSLAKDVLNAARSWKAQFKALAADKMPDRVKLLKRISGAAGSRSFTFDDQNAAALRRILQWVRGSLEAAVAAEEPPPVTGDDAKLIAVALARHAVFGEFGDEQSRLAMPAWAVNPACIDAAKRVIERAGAVHYLLDELQDTDAAQFELFAMLAQSHGGVRLTAVGDCDQSICACLSVLCPSRRAETPRLLVASADAFRGASYKRLQHAVECLFCAADWRLLANNYRSTPAIVAACAALLTPNYSTSVPPVPPAKALVAVRRQGVPVQLVQCSDAQSQRACIIREITAWRAAGLALGALGAGVGDGMAVLCASNAEVHAFLKHLRSAGFTSAVASSKAELRAPPPGALTISTIHGVKGLEFEAVFLLLPASLWRAEEAEMAEHRRVGYVAASRPRSLLHVSYTGTAHPFATQLRSTMAQELLQEATCSTTGGSHNIATLLGAVHEPEAAAHGDSDDGIW
jgi:superfamily I DNA/RNA helicase